MLSIGDFARFAGVSVRRLRHYDALGLLPPSYVDPRSGYRFYEPSLLARLDALVAFRALGFSLEQIGDLLDRDDQIGLLEQRRGELRDQIAIDRSRLAEVERRIRLLQGEEMSGLSFVEKSLPSLELAQLTDQVDDVAALGERVGPLFGRVYGALAAAGVQPTGPGIGWYDSTDAGMKFGAGVESPPVAGLQSGTLPAHERAVTAVYQGSMAGIGLAWQELARYVEQSGLEFAGPCREVYLQAPTDAPDEWVTELQQPVA